MPNNLVDANTLNLKPIPPAPAPPIPALSKDQEPHFSGYQVSPFPFGTSNPDSQRQFFLGSKFPTTRLLVPAPQTNTGSGTVTETANILSIGSGGSGGTGGGGAVVPPQVAVNIGITTPVLSPGQIWTGVLALKGKTWDFLNLTVSDFSRVELYASVSAQQNDIGRSVYLAPNAGTLSGIISDVLINNIPLEWDYIDTFRTNDDNPTDNLIYISVTNFSQASETISLAIVYVPLSF